MRENIYVHYLCNLQTYCHQICTAGTSDMDAPTDRITPGFLDHRGAHGDACQFLISCGRLSWLLDSFCCMLNICIYMSYLSHCGLS